ncbi:alpha-D-ribose 1-methylphosphonate 5-phosphate C-P-lyase PhnJ [Escherichia coli]
MANLSGYTFAYLDEQTKTDYIFPAAPLKAVAIPNLSGAVWRRRHAHAIRLGNGWYTAHRQRDWRKRRVEGDRPGCDDTTNAVSIRNFFKRVTGVNTTERTDDATLIQTRHRIPKRR